EPGSEQRTSSGCGRQLENLREKIYLNKTWIVTIKNKPTNKVKEFYSKPPDRLKEDSWRSRTPWCIRTLGLFGESPSMGPKPSSFFIVFATLATSPEYGSLSTPL
ncbi:hypothetical protein GOODEAATRI_006264, partial [Goodea atripinnis]